jgi:hypothetical protein
MALNFDPSSLADVGSDLPAFGDSGSGVDGTGDSLDLSGSSGGNNFDSWAGGSPLNIDLTGGAPSPSSSGSSDLWTNLQQGLGFFQGAANIGLGAYRAVSNPTAQQTGQPERTADGRYVANIQGKPTVLTPQTTTNSTLMLIGLVVVGVVLLKSLEK